MGTWWRVSGLILGHGCIAAVWIFVFWLLEQEIVFLRGGGAPPMFGVLPLEYIFQGLDLTVLAVLFYATVTSAIQEFRFEREQRESDEISIVRP
jgi:hypothetical protein